MKPDPKTMTDANLMSQWGVATKAMNAAFRDLQAVSRIRAEYNRKSYLKLHRTEEGTRQYDAVQIDIDATEAAARKSFDAAASACSPYADEARLRGLVTDADRVKL
jgi:hypothetical protein